MLAALVTSALPVPVMTFLPGLLSGFLAYLYTWYCFPKLSSFEKRMQSVPLEAFIQGLAYALTGTCVTGIYTQILCIRTLTK